MGVFVLILLAFFAGALAGAIRQEGTKMSTEEFRVAYDTIRRYCTERDDNCKGCHMANVCYSDCMPPKNWPDLEDEE